MRHLCLIYDEEKRRESMSKSEAEAFTDEYVAFTAGTRKDGHYLGGEPLEPGRTATIVRVRHGKVIVAEDFPAVARRDPSARRFRPSSTLAVGMAP